MIDLDELDRLHASLPELDANSWLSHEDNETAVVIATVLSEDDSDVDLAKDLATNAVAILRAYPALAAEVRALREVADAARAFVPTCEETHVPDGGDEPVACGQRATHIDRLSGHDLGPICAEHAELVLASARKAASKGHTRAVERDAPRDIDPDARVDRLAAALAKVPR